MNPETSAQEREMLRILGELRLSRSAIAMQPGGDIPEGTAIADSGIYFLSPGQRVTFCTGGASKKFHVAAVPPPPEKLRVPPGVQLAPAVRLGDAEKDAALRRLGEAHVLGQLDAAQFGIRQEAAQLAVTRAELDLLVSDLPPAEPEEKREAQAPGRRQHIAQAVLMFIYLSAMIRLAVHGSHQDALLAAVGVASASAAVMLAKVTRR